MRYVPGESPEFDAQMRAIAELPPEARLHWLEERRQLMWDLASDLTRRAWVQQWLDSPTRFTLEQYERALASVHQTLA